MTRNDCSFFGVVKAQLEPSSGVVGSRPSAKLSLTKSRRRESHAVPPPPPPLPPSSFGALPQEATKRDKN